MKITGMVRIRPDAAEANTSGLIAGATGAPGGPGPAGPQGQPGRGVSSLSINDQNNLVVVYDDGEVQSVGAVAVLTQGVDGGTF